MTQNAENKSQSDLPYCAQKSNCVPTGEIHWFEGKWSSKQASKQTYTHQDAM